MFDKVKVPKNPHMPIFDKMDTKPQVRSLAMKVAYDADMLEKLVKNFPAMAVSHIPDIWLQEELKRRGYIVAKKRR